MKARDLTIINVVTGLAVIHFLLKTKDTLLEAATWFYAMTWIISLVMLLWMQVYHGQPSPRDVTDYDENLSRNHLPWLFGGVAAVVIVSSVLVAGFTRSALYVPRPSAVLSSVPLSSAALIDDLLYNFVLVAPAEETMKLMGIMALYQKTRNEWISVAVPVGIWAGLHGYFAYVGGLMPVLIFSAFLSGLVLYVVMRQTGSLLNAVLAHAAFNSLIVLSSLF
jgi:membrane protease YdiL (CAAX protease family)